MLLDIAYLVFSLYLCIILILTGAQVPVDRLDEWPGDVRVYTRRSILLPQFPLKFPSPLGLSGEWPEMSLGSLTSVGLGNKCFLLVKHLTGSFIVD
jgi:hypothetical protein